MYEQVKIIDGEAEFLEPVGSKRKFWYANRSMLFKEIRPDTGEDWAEVIAGAVAELLGLPHAIYKLALIEASSGTVFGVATQNFCAPNFDLVLGNELVLQEDPHYPGQPTAKYRVAAHTVDRVLNAITSRGLLLPLEWPGQSGIDTASYLFVGYLLLDALVGNTDRHHENWGAVSTRGRRLFLAPTFDHASSLGCHITDRERARRLSTADKGYAVEAYATKARSALYENESASRPLTTAEAFFAAADRQGSSCKLWLDRLRNIPEQSLANIVEGIPEERMSKHAVEFAKRMIRCNRSRLLGEERAR